MADVAYCINKYFGMKVLFNLRAQVPGFGIITNLPLPAMAWVPDRTYIGRWWNHPKGDRWIGSDRDFFTVVIPPYGYMLAILFAVDINHLAIFHLCGRNFRESVKGLEGGRY
jgi:hypothetical protein